MCGVRGLTDPADMTSTTYTTAIAARARVRDALAVAAIAAQGLFIGSWLWAGAVEGHGYSATRHDISDLGALTAHHATPFALGIGAAGALTILFAIAALRPALEIDGRPTPVGAWLVALSLPGLDNLSDAFFRLDCRAADAGCSSSDAMASWHGVAHIAVFAIAALATVAAPFALAARMRVVDGWRDLVGPTRLFGVVTVIALAATAATAGTSVQGLTQRIAATIVPLGVAALAVRVLRQSSYEPGS
jgi:hypothetical protein